MRLRHFLPSAACSALALLTSSGHAQANETPDDALNLQFANGIAAVAEHQVITVDDVRREIAPSVAQLQREARNEQEFHQKLEALQDDTIQNLIDRVLIVKEFRKDEKKRIPMSFIDERLAAIQAEQFDGDRSKFLAYLRSRGMTVREYRREVEEDIIYGWMRQQQRKSQSLVSPVRIETYYNENKDRFFQEDEVHLRLIQFTRTNGESDVELRSKAEAVLSRLRSGEKFEDIAREVSQDSRRTRGGDWGWLKRSDLKREFSDPMFELKPSEVSEPLMLPEGCFLLYVEDRKFAGIQTIDQVRDQIEIILLTQMARTSQERWLERLRRNGYVKHY